MSLQVRIKRAKRWLALSKTRKFCGDAYGDLLLATAEYGAAKREAPTSPAVEQLMDDLLVQSHALRVRCQVRLRARTR